jgi:O-antigen/teichoic acid export membrane protein
MVFTVTVFLAGLSNLGTKATLNRWLPLLRKEGKEEEGSHLLLTSLFVQFLGIALFAFIMFLLKQNIVAYYGQQRLAPLIDIGIVYLIGFSMVDFAFLVLQSYQKWASESLLSALYPLLFLAFTLAALFLFDAEIASVLYCNFGAAAMASLVAFYFLCHEVKREHWRSFNLAVFFSQCHRIATFGFPLLLATLNFFLLALFDKIILGRYGGPEELSIFYISVTFADVLMLLSKGMSTVLMPHVAELTDEDEIRRKYKLIFRMHLYMAIAVSVSMLILIDPIVSLLYGSGYRDAALALKWLLIPFFIRSVWHTPGMFLQNVFGLIHKANLAYMGMVLFHVLLDLILIPMYGYQGAIATRGLAYGFYLIFVMGFIRENRQLTPFGCLFRSLVYLGVLGLSYGFLHYMQWDYILVTLPLLLGLFAALLISFKEIGRGSPLPIQDLVAAIGLGQLASHLTWKDLMRSRPLKG